MAIGERIRFIRNLQIDDLADLIRMTLSLCCGMTASEYR